MERSRPNPLAPWVAISELFHIEDDAVTNYDRSGFGFELRHKPTDVVR